MEINIEGVTKNYRNRFTLQDIECTLHAGVYGLVGPNGAGKTTLLRILATILLPDKGRILVDGKDISLNEEGYRSLIGYLPQKLGFYRQYTVLKFLQYMSVLKGMPREEAGIRISKLLLELNLTSYKHQKIRTLSEGVKQRIGIAQALLNDPDFLILDEPTLNLDPKERINFRNIIGSLSKDKTILISTHIISDIEYIAKEIILLDQGKIRAKATPRQLLQEMSNKVWDAFIEVEQLLDMQERYQITDIRHSGDFMKIRIIADNKPHIESQQAEAELDDLYMYYFRQEDMPC